MDFMATLLVPDFVTSTTLDPRDWWEKSKTNAWTDWDSIEECCAISWQWCINKFFSKDNCTSRK